MNLSHSECLFVKLINTLIKDKNDLSIHTLRPVGGLDLL